MNYSKDMFSSDPDVKTEYELEIERKLIEKHPDQIKYIRNPSPELLRLAEEACIKRIEEDPEWIRNVRNPSDKMREAAMGAYIKRHIAFMERDRRR